MKALEAGKALAFIRNMNVPLLDISDFEELRHIPEAVRLKI